MIMKSLIELARVAEARDMAPRGGADKDRDQHHILMSLGVGHLTQRDCCRGNTNRGVDGPLFAWVEAEVTKY